MDFDAGMEMVKKAYEEKVKERMWQMYLVYLPNMSKENLISFEEFLELANESDEQDNRSAEEILEEVKNIINNFK